MSNKKIEKINDLLLQLFIFDQKEIEELQQRIPYMKEEGLDELIKTLEEGLKNQEAMLKQWIKREPKFADELSGFVMKESKALVQEAEKEERDSAEEILSEIK
ncbi:MAG: hypothetical protein OEY44_04610 [Candidatus Peregrinibacteria bacterium]|nr:hypothetical protein [Candidatus Peregrinibacteria bacterium]